MTPQNSIFSITKISILMFIKTIVHKQIKIKSISAPLGSTLTTTTYSTNICAFILEKKTCRSNWFSHNITFLCAHSQLYRISSAL